MELLVERDPRVAAPKRAWGRHATLTIGAIDGDPCGVRSASGVCRNVWRDAIRPLLLEPSVELAMGRDPCEGCAEMGVGTPCEPSLWGRRWSSLWATIHVRGVPIWVERMRTLSLGLPSELPVGHDALEG